ncbi:MAG: hypothetical protein CM1200mP14_20370 [Gammaproteobacteria bacterium]|nr:MAG: hypothetical protein CM1200mP14_20370 [Gammaproteobacteria bacterium]
MTVQSQLHLLPGTLYTEYIEDEVDIREAGHEVIEHQASPTRTVTLATEI